MMSNTQQQQDTKTVIPEWVCEIIDEVSKSKEITLEQATKLLILHGALYYELKKEQNNA